MLSSLIIENVVLIEHLDLDLETGLCVLTGETGAGKSILLDSLGLALGKRADASLVRKGQAGLSVTAVFDLPAQHPALAMAQAQDLPAAEDQQIILRRTVKADGRSKAYINDKPVSLGILRDMGQHLVEIHGQFDTHGMMDSSTHMAVLDSFLENTAPAAACTSAFTAWKHAEKARRTYEAELESIQAQEEKVRHDLEYLQKLAPQDGEEQTLAAQRNLMMNSEKLLDGLNGAMLAITEGQTIEAVQDAQRSLDRILAAAETRISPIIDALDRAASEIAEAQNDLERFLADVDLDPAELERVEERLFALRAAARKFECTPDELPAVQARLQEQLHDLDGSGFGLKALKDTEHQAKAAYISAAETLRRHRQAAAAHLDTQVAKELPPLKMEKARFSTAINPLDEKNWSATGMDDVAFLIATNPGAAPGPLGKIASGGELSRFMLALKVVLAQRSTVPTMVFDEVDAGIGGATAAAVGSRLAQLAQHVQVLVVTHAPQVAAKGNSHWHVAKSSTKDSTRTTITPLPHAARVEELARMVAGSEITAEARAAAESLLNAS
jgi:DNA repair protein RecN (Recombination protein N)